MGTAQGGPSTIIGMATLLGRFMRVFEAIKIEVIGEPAPQSQLPTLKTQ